MDTTHLEYTAEDLIAHKLQRGGLLVAKPKFDRDGTDLIALIDVADAAKFCRIQCKGRTLIKKKASNVVIPEEYVKGAFFVFLYVDTGENTPHIFCFSNNEITSHWKLKPDKKLQKKYYHLNFTRKTIFDKDNKLNLLEFLFTDDRIEQIKKIIRSSISANEINMFHLIKKQQNLIKNMDEIHRLEIYINEATHANELVKIHSKELTILKKQYKNALSNIGPKIPKNLKEKIIQLLRNKISVDKIIKQVKDIIPDDVHEKILKDYISQIMVTK